MAASNKRLQAIEIVNKGNSMAESRAKRMQVVLQLAQRQEDAAAQTLSQAREQFEVEQQQMQQLRDYAAQYHQEYAGQRQAVQAQQLINYSGFVTRLGELCREQEAKLRRLQLGLNQLQAQWRTAYQKRKAVAELIERLLQEEAQQQDRRQQKAMDEFSSQQYSRQRDSNE